MGWMGHDLDMKSRVHPKHKTKYRVSNWAEYDRALVQRGDITLWLSEEAIASWKPAPTGLRGAQRKFSDHAIETALTLRLVFKLPLRQAEGFLRSILSLMGVDLVAPDHTTLSRRSQHLNIQLANISTNRPLHLIVDSTGLSIVGEGEWAAVKHGKRGRRGWKKLHLGVDRSGVIVAQTLTDGNADDAKTALDLIDKIEGEITSVTADAAYDTLAIYDAAAARNAKVVVPPSKSATRSRRRRSRSSARDRTIMRVKEIGRRQWKKESGYHRQARVENTFFRYKTTIGPELRARHPEAQEAEAIIACSVLNRMMGLGRPESFAIAD
jgi:IS5 family transposase